MRERAARNGRFYAVAGSGPRSQVSPCENPSPASYTAMRGLPAADVGAVGYKGRHINQVQGTNMMKKLLIASMMAVGLAGCGAMMGGSGAPQRSVGQAVDDVTIGTKLKAALASDPQLSALKINVDTTQGNVRLKGEVKSFALRKKAEDLARSIEGVKSVDNQLIVTG